MSNRSRPAPLITPTAFVLAGLPFAVACGSSTEDDPIQFDEPQIVPASNVLCLSYEDLAESSTTAHFVQLTNRGRQPLIIRGAEVAEEDVEGAFAVDKVRSLSGQDCTESSPCWIASTEDAILRFLFMPKRPGWYTAILRVLSNAQNFPRLRLFVLARARPASLDAGVPFDAGPKPPNAVGADGSESCP